MLFRKRTQEMPIVSSSDVLSERSRTEPIIRLEVIHDLETDSMRISNLHLVARMLESMPHGDDLLWAAAARDEADRLNSTYVRPIDAVEASVNSFQ